MLPAADEIDSFLGFRDRLAGDEGFGLLGAEAALDGALVPSVVYLGLGWVKTVPLLVMTVGAHGALVLIGALFGLVTMSMRATVAAGRLELGSANAVRRNLLVLWNLCLLMACLGWLAFGAGAATAPVPIGTLATIAEAVAS